MSQLLFLTGRKEYVFDALVTAGLSNHCMQHIRHFIKIICQQGIKFINLPSVFKDTFVISSIPTYFENKESPIICCKYNKPIPIRIAVYYKLVTELDIETTIPDS